MYGLKPRSGTRAVGQGELLLNVKDYGAKGDGTTDDTAAILAAIADIPSEGGVLYFPKGTYLISGTLVVSNGTKMVGEGVNASVIQLANGSNCDMVQSTGFATLTGNNKWLTSDGVVHGIGFDGLRFNGNKANQSSGRGVALYAKRITVGELLIMDCHDVGWYSECGDKSGQTDWTDLPESKINCLRVRNCGGDGIVWNGPHDARIDTLLPSSNGGRGAVFERTVGMSTGESDVGFIHSYGNTGQGIYISASCRIRGNELIGESNGGEGIYIDGWNSQIAMVQAYSNCTSSGSYQVVVTGNGNILDNVKIEKCAAAVGGLQITGAQNSVNVTADGNATSAAVGVDVSSVGNRVRGRSTNFTPAGGIGLRTGNSTTLSSSHIQMEVDNNATGWSNSTSGTLNVYQIVGIMGAGQVLFAGSGPNSTAGNEKWEVRGTENGTYRTSRVKKQSGGTLDMNSTALQGLNISITEMIKQPTAPNISAILNYTGGGSWTVAMPLTMTAISSTQVSFAFQLSVGAGAGKTATIELQAEL
jgi:hypothetical protein